MASNRPDSSSSSARDSDAPDAEDDALFGQAKRQLFKEKKKAEAAIHALEQTEAAVLRFPRAAKSSQPPVQPAMPDAGSSLSSYDDSSQDKTIDIGDVTGASEDERRQKRQERPRPKRKWKIPAKKTLIPKSKSVFYIFIFILI